MVREHLHDQQNMSCHHKVCVKTGSFVFTACQESEFICIVCRDRTRDTILLPCGHFNMCRQCVPSIKPKCPTCRKHIGSEVTVESTVVWHDECPRCMGYKLLNIWGNGHPVMCSDCWNPTMGTSFYRVYPI